MEEQKRRKESRQVAVFEVEASIMPLLRAFKACCKKLTLQKLYQNNVLELAVQFERTKTAVDGAFKKGD